MTLDPAAAQAPTHPTISEIGLLFIMQLGFSLVGTVIMAVLAVPAGSGSWVSVVAAMLGAQIYAVFVNKKYPGRLTKPFSVRLALAAAVLHTVIGAAVLLFFVLPELGQQDGLLAMFFALPLAFGATYGLSLWGLRLGMRIRSEPTSPSPSE